MIEEAVRPGGVEAMDPIAQSSPIPPANPGGFAPVLAVAAASAPPALIDVLRAPGQGPKLLSREILSKFHRCWHGGVHPVLTGHRA